MHLLQAEPKIRVFVYPMLKDDFTLVETYKVMVAQGMPYQRQPAVVTAGCSACQYALQTSTPSTITIEAATPALLLHTSRQHRRACQPDIICTHRAPSAYDHHVLQRRKSSPNACSRRKPLLPPVMQPSAPDVKTSVPITAIGARLDNRYTPQQVRRPIQHHLPASNA
jgi:hypothetical protein